MKISFCSRLLRKIIIVIIFLSLNLTNNTTHPIAQAVNTTENPPTFLPIVFKGYCNPSNMGAKYLFLDNTDLLRIKEAIASDSQTQLAWSHLKEDVDQFMANFPTTYNPNDGSGVVWYGGGHYYPRDLGLVYLVTGDPYYGEGILRLLQLVVSNSGSGPGGDDYYHGLFVPTSHLGVTYQSFLFMYLTIRDTSWLNDLERSAYDNFFKGQVKTLLAKFTYPFSPLERSPQFAVNYPLTADVAGATLALPFLSDPDIKNLYLYAHHNIEQRLMYWFDQDGGWGEYADSYSPTVLEELVLYFEALTRSGCNFYQVNYNGKTMHTLCEWFIKDMVPEGSWPALNDGVWIAEDMGFLKLCSARTGDPVLAFGADRSIYGYQHLFNRGWRGLYSLFNTVAWANMAVSSEPLYISSLQNNTGLAILRSGWATDSSYLSIQFTDSRRHVHYSYGNIDLYDRGAWLVDNGYQLDNGGYMGEQYYRSIRTVEHSTLNLDHNNQTFTGGSALIFSDLYNSAMASVQSESYADMQHTRTVLWAKPWHQWIVLDDAAISGINHTLQLNWFVKTEPGSVSGNRWIFQRDSDQLVIDLLPGQTANIFSTSRYYDSFWDGRANGVALEIMPAQSWTRLASILTSRLSPIIGTYPEVSRSDSSTETHISIVYNNQTWDWIVSNTLAGDSSIGNLSLAGAAGCRLSASGATISYCLYKGSSLLYETGSMIISDYPISVDASLQQGILVTDGVYATNLQLYWPNPINSIYDETGRLVNYERAGNMILLTIQPGRHSFTLQ
jgi:hypothetical protein